MKVSKFIQLNTESGRVWKAMTFGSYAHKEQVRKYTGEPYFNHCIEVATILALLGCEDEDMIIAALLHDTLEDTDTTVEELIFNFGERVAWLVSELTDLKTGGNRAERKKRDLVRLSFASFEAKIIKCCDLISNTKDIAQHDKNFAKIYLAEKRAILLNVLHVVPNNYFKAVEESLIRGQQQLSKTT